MPLTMAELAKKAGVSVATISLVLSDHPRISPLTKAKVKLIMEENHYVPNAIARGLVNQSLKTIGVVMSLGPGQALRHPYIFEMLSGMESGLRDGGYQLLLHHWDVWNQSPQELVNLWEQKRVDGFILQLTPPLLGHLSPWKERGLPFVLIGNPGDEYDAQWVEVDNSGAGFLAGAQLRTAGFKTPGFLGIRGDGIQAQRFQGFLEEAGLNNPPPVLWIEPNLRGEAVRRLIPKTWDSVICGSHYLALNLLETNLGILTFDNLPYMDELHPTLSTIDIDVFTLGYKAAAGLVQKLANPDYKLQEKLPLARFIPRQSTIISLK